MPRVKKARPSVYGTGFLALDMVRSALRKTSISAYAGGTCGNVLAILAYLGWDAYPVARLNGDAASQRVRADLRSLGVKLDFAACKPVVSTPIVVQTIRRTPSGARHRFAWTCPECGSTLPRFRAIPRSTVPRIVARMLHPSVFFMDRVSRSSLDLARAAATRGALVYFEPSVIGDATLFKRALRLAHVVKYSSDRLRSWGPHADSVLLEIQTLGERGLMYRSQLGGHATWMHLPSVPALKLIDACGAGDWCSAGIIARLGAAGLDGLFAADEAEIAEAMRYGQKLAAWNCGFEGARGGMYRSYDFSAQIGQTVMSLRPTEMPPLPPDVPELPRILCPACPLPAAGRIPLRG